MYVEVKELQRNSGETLNSEEELPESQDEEECLSVLMRDYLSECLDNMYSKNSFGYPG